jgi:hypothetical protein
MLADGPHVRQRAIALRGLGRTSTCALPNVSGYDAARKRQVYRALVEGLATVPGVQAVGANSTRLLMGGRWDSNVTIPGVAATDGTYPWSYARRQDQAHPGPAARVSRTDAERR